LDCPTGLFPGLKAAYRGAPNFLCRVGSVVMPLAYARGRAVTYLKSARHADQTGNECLPVPRGVQKAETPMMKRKLLVIDDDPQMRFFLEQALKTENYDITLAESAEEGLEHLRQENFGLIMTDVRLPGMSGLDALREIKSINPQAVVIVMTAFSSRDTALEAVKRGAYDFFPKPFKVSEMRIVIRRALERVELTEEIDKLKRELHNREKFTALVGQGEPFLDMLSRLEKVAPIPSTVLIVGESGTGKELVAEAIHDNSTRAGKPLVKINCAAIPATLLESELFGYKKGAFTHATSDREGKFQAAHTGTLVLDEMGDLSLDLQAKLLRALEQQEVQRVGSAVPEQVDVRVVASTNRPLEKLLEEKKFREDLYYRLAVFQVRVPPLRDRLGDIAVLARHFVKMYADLFDKPLVGLTDDAVAVLNAYNWPGNVRELKNCIEAASVMTDRDIIDVGDLPPHVVSGRGSDDLDGQGKFFLDETLSRIEKQMILDALTRTNGVQVKAAQLLGINERSMWHRVKKYDIEVASFQT